MGLSKQSTGHALMQEGSLAGLSGAIALAGNPNVGKSTVFNYLTGLNQHTGNWPGKTVAHAEGAYTYRERTFRLVDLPGTYSLDANSPEEEITRDYICFHRPEATVIVADATCLERNLNLTLQVMAVCPRVILCVNLLDEARKKKIKIDLEELSAQLGIPVIGTSARSGQGLTELQEALYQLTAQETQQPTYPLHFEEDLEAALQTLNTVLEQQEGLDLPCRWLAQELLEAEPSFLEALNDYTGDLFCERPAVSEAILAARRLTAADPRPLRDRLVGVLVAESERLYAACVTLGNQSYTGFDRKLDQIVTSKRTGIPLMLALLALVFWITIAGANYPSALLSSLFDFLEGKLALLFTALSAPAWLQGLLVEGVFRTLGWVISVMLPPMAIFFPLFTLLEDSGYLPRVAFNMDKYFKKAGACGKQCLTTMMGFGCNACGVIGCRIINSPRERLIAILTNSFVPCNGRFPTLIAILTMFFVGSVGGLGASLLSALLLTALIALGVFLSLLASRLLSHTVLKGLPSSFTLELPPYRKPQIGQVIVRSIFDRTLFVLGRAVVVAAPAGLVIWLLGNLNPGGVSLLTQITAFLDPLGRFMGLDGVILLAFLLGFPANEIVIPLIIMGYLSLGSMVEFASLTELQALLVDNGWTWVTALCTMLFSLVHFPCATTCLTIRKESGSWKWTALAFILPTVCGFLLCSLIANLNRFIF